VRDIKEVGDQIVVLATFSARGSGSGVQRQHEDGFVWTVRDGKATRRCRSSCRSGRARTTPRRSS
jgi:hypothetical protein